MCRGVSLLEIVAFDEYLLWTRALPTSNYFTYSLRKLLKLRARVISDAN